MYEQFAKFVGETKSPNRFWPVDPATLKLAEKRLKYSLPGQLRQFLVEIGYGFYSKGVKDKKRTHVNRILSPSAISDMLTKRGHEQRPPEGFPRGTMPFFDLGEFTYLLLKPRSTSPDTVYGADGETVVAQSVQEFFGLLYEKADFYRDRL